MHKKTKKKVNLKQISHILKSFFSITTFLLSVFSFAQTENVDSLNQISLSDTSAILLDSTQNNDTISLKVEPESVIENTINYTAKDSIKVDVIRQKVYIYGDAKVVYGTMTLKAEFIEIDWTKNQLSAKGGVDSLGNEFGIPNFKEGTDEYNAHSILYNFESKKGLITGIITQQGEGYIHGDTVMKNEYDEMFIKTAKYTTCNLDHPHFYIQSTKMKMVPDKVVVSGPFNIVIEDIPTPIGFLFGIFPMPKEKNSGIVPPSPSTVGRKGLGLMQGGYYWGISDKLDAKLIGDIFMNGSWRAELLTNYFSRYKHRGLIKFGMSQINDGYNEDTLGSRKSIFDRRGYILNWNHSQLTNKNSKFSADVQIQSPTYNSDNFVNYSATLQNQFNSNIKYHKKFGNTPFSLDMNLKMDQANAGNVVFKLPSTTLRMQRQNPFSTYRGFGKNYIKQFNFDYTANFDNEFSNIKTNDLFNFNFNNLKVPIIGDRERPDTLNARQLSQSVFNGKFGFKHGTTIQNPIKLKNDQLTLTPNLTYNEIYYDKKLDYNWVVDSNKLGINVVNGFQRIQDYNYGVNLTTVMYSFLAIKGKNIPVIRNRMTPSIGYLYRPDFSGFTLNDINYSANKYVYQELVQKDTLGSYGTFSKYHDFIYVVPTNKAQNFLNYSLSNNIEMKVNNKKDTLNPTKKIDLIRQLNFASSYDFTADSMNFAPLNVNASTSLFGINIVYTSAHSFYKLDSTGGILKEVNQLYSEGRHWSQPLRTTNANFTLTKSFKPKARVKKEIDESTLNEREKAELEYLRNNPSMYVDFSVPWSLNVNYNLRWVKGISTKDTMQLTQTLAFTGDLSLTKKWKVAFSSTYDVVGQSFAASSISIVRDLHCWQLSIDWVPTGFNRSISFKLNALSPMLQDILKVNQQRNRLN